MTVVVSKGLISRAFQSSSDQSQTQAKATQEVQAQVARGSDSARAVVIASAVASASSDAAINSVRVSRAERAEGRVRSLKEADELADNLGQRIREGEDGTGEYAHSGLDPIGASGHL